MRTSSNKRQQLPSRISPKTPESDAFSFIKGEMDRETKFVVHSIDQRDQYMGNPLLILEVQNLLPMLTWSGLDFVASDDNGRVPSAIPMIRYKPRFPSRFFRLPIYAEVPKTGLSSWNIPASVKALYLKFARFRLPMLLEIRTLVAIAVTEKRHSNHPEEERTLEIFVRRCSVSSCSVIISGILQA